MRSTFLPRDSSEHHAFSNALSPMTRRDCGSTSASLWRLYMNARSPISSRPSFHSIRLPETFWNASSPMVRSVEGNTMYSMLHAWRNACAPIVSSPSGRISP